MNKKTGIIFFCFLMLHFYVLKSQTVLYPVNLPVAGDLWSNKTITDTTIQPGISGNGVIWNFSNYFVNPSVLSEHFVTPTGTSNDLLFPAANLKVTSFFGTEDYYYKASNYLQYLGSKNNAIELIISNSSIQKMLDVPMHYGDSIVNPAVTGTGLQGYPITGSIKVKADGAGDLTLFTGAFVSTLRVVTDINLVIAPGTGVDTYLRILKHTWYSTLYRAPVFQIAVIELDGPLGSSHQKHITVSTLTTDIENPFSPALNFTISPNPAKSKTNIHIFLNKNSEVNFKITDLTGRLLIEEKRELEAGNQSVMMDYSELPRGIYLLSLISGNLNRQQRLILE